MFERKLRSGTAIFLCMCFTLGNEDVASERVLPSLQHDRVIQQLESAISSDFLKKKAEIMNWKAYGSLRVWDTDVHICQYVKPALRGIGGVIKSRWGDFRVTERRLEDNSCAEITDLSCQVKGERGKFLKFVLYKAGRDTFEMVRRLAQELGLTTQDISFAGLKDRGGITQQELCIESRLASPEKILALNGVFKRVLVGNFMWSSHGLHYGEHSGNTFSIVVRHIETDLEMTRKAVRKWKKHGFCNYYGHQRFGINSASGIPSIEVGRALVKGHFRVAVDAVLDPSFAIGHEERQAKERWMNGKNLKSASEALREMPFECANERFVLQSLIKQSKDLNNNRQDFSNDQMRKACDTMPQRFIFIQSFWSRLWNEALTLRSNLYGLRGCVEGDLVRLRTEKRDDGMKVDHVHVVTASEAKNKKFDIFDVVLPVFGAGVEVKYPNNKLKYLMEKLLHREGVFGVVKQIRKKAGVLLPQRVCSYRSIVTRPKNVSYKFINYRPGQHDLQTVHSCGGGDIRMDKNTSNLVYQHPTVGRNSKRRASVDEEGMKLRIRTEEGGKEQQYRWNALWIKFTLDPGSFATMSLRELMKTSTHPSRMYHLRKLYELEEEGQEWDLLLRPLGNRNMSVLLDPDKFIEEAVSRALAERMGSVQA